MAINEDPPPKPVPAQPAPAKPRPARVFRPGQEAAEKIMAETRAEYGPPQPKKPKTRRRPEADSLGYVIAGALQDWRARPVDVEQVRLLDEVRECDLAINRAHAARAAAIDRVAVWVAGTAETGRPLPVMLLTREAQDAGETGRPLQRWSEKKAAEEGLVAELGCLLRVHEHTARNLLCISKLLQHDLPATRAKLENGTISYRHVEVIVDNALSLPSAAWAAFEAEALTGSEDLSVGQLKKRAITVRELTHPESIVTRHKKALSQRCFSVMPAPDGMAYLELTLSHEDAAAITDRVDTLARSLHNAAQQDPVDSRTLRQQRLDVAVDLLLTGVTETGLGAGVQGLVNVTVPVLTLMGLSEEPGTLDGFGPIDADAARRVAATAKSFTRILIHPETSTVLSVGKTHYKVPADLKKWLEIRDGTCRFPGCTRGAKHSEVDHTHDWQYNGQTRWDNLAHLCKRGHRLKTETGWRVTQGTDGVLHWTSPAGKHYATHPATRLGPNSAATRELSLTTETAKRPVDIWAELADPHHDWAGTPF